MRRNRIIPAATVPRKPLNAPASAAEARRLGQRGNLFKVAADPAIRTVADHCLQTMGFKNTAKVLRALFGARAPSKSALHRYHRRLAALAGQAHAAGAAAIAPGPTPLEGPEIDR